MGEGARAMTFQVGDRVRLISGGFFDRIYCSREYTVRHVPVAGGQYHCESGDGTTVCPFRDEIELVEAKKKPLKGYARWVKAIEDSYEG
jgi:hypothetical protein